MAQWRSRKGEGGGGNNTKTQHNLKCFFKKGTNKRDMFILISNLLVYRFCEGGKFGCWFLSLSDRIPILRFYSTVQ